MLVIVKDRDLHAFAQFALDIETIGGFDIFKVDATKRGLERSNDVDQLVEVLLVNLQVEYINTCELFKQNALTFHHRLGSQGADITQAQHSGTVGDHGHQVATAGVFEGVVWVFDNFFAGRGDTG